MLLIKKFKFNIFMKKNFFFIIKINLISIFVGTKKFLKLT